MNKKSSIYFIFTIVSLCLTLFITDLNAATLPSLEMKAVSCKNYADTYDDLNACKDDYVAGDLDTFVLNSGDKVETGTTVMFILNLKLGDSTSVIGAQTTLAVDPNIWEPFTYKEFDDDPDEYKMALLITPQVSTLPSTYYEQLWNYDFNTNEVSGSLLDGRKGRERPLTKDTEVLYFFLKLKEGATGTVGIEFQSPAGMHIVTEKGATSGSNTKTVIPTEDFKLSVAGDAISTDSSLGTLKVIKGDNNYILKPTFVPGPSGFNVKEYSTVVAADAATAIIEATAYDTGGFIVGYSPGETYSKTVSLNPGNNKFTVTVSAPSGDTENYTVNIYRLSSDASLKNLTLDGINNFTFVKGTKDYRIEVPYRTDLTTVNALTTHPNAFISSGTGEWSLTNYGTQENVRTIVSRAENCITDYTNVPGRNCTQETYTITINRKAPSQVKTLSALKYKTNINTQFRTVPSFSSNTFEYQLPNVSYETNSISFDATLSDSLASIEIPTFFPLEVGENTIRLTVVPEDPNTSSQDYIIKVYRLSANNNLASLEVKSTPQGTFSPRFGDSSTDTYSYSYDATVETITITANVSDTDKARVAIYDAEDPSSAVSTLNTQTKEFGVETENVRIMVTAEDEKTKIYNLSLTRNISSDTRLKKLEISNENGDIISLSPAFTIDNKLYNAQVNADTDKLNVDAETFSKYARIISISGNENLNYGTNSVTVRVQAENPEATGNYIVTVNREYHHEATLENIYIDGKSLSEWDSSITFNRDTHEYTINTPFPYATSKVNVTVDKTNDLATVSGTGEVNLVTDKNKIIINVTAHDGTTKGEYVINLTRNKNSDNSISNLKVKGVSAVLDREKIYAVTLPNSVTRIEASDVTFDRASDSRVSMGEGIDLSTKNVNEYKFTVIAENGDEKEYTIKITRTRSGDVSMGEVSVRTDKNVVKTCQMNNSTKSCVIEVPTDTTSFTLDASIHDEATILPLNGEAYAMPPEESIKTVSLIVTAENGNTETYNVRVERQLSSNNLLSYIKLNGKYLREYALDGIEFRPDLLAYELYVDGDTDEVTIETEVVDTGKAKILTDLSKPFKLDFDTRNKIEIRVQAENKENEKTYTLYVTRRPRQDVSLSDLTIDGKTIKGFESSKLEYYLDDVEYSKYQLNVQATPTDAPRATASGNGLKTLVTGDNTIEIVVTAHDTSVKEKYVIHVNRAKNTSTVIEEVTLAGVKAIWDNVDKKYKVTVPNSVNEANQSNLSVKVEDPISAGDTRASVSFSNKTLVTTEANEVVITVTPEDPDTNPKEYILEITREQSKVATLSSLRVDTTNQDGEKGSGSFNPSFIPNNDTHLEYTITVPVDATSIDITAVKTDPNSKITSGINSDGTKHIVLTDSNQTVEIAVTSEDESVTNTYVLTITRIQSSVNTLKTITITTDAGGKYTLDLTVDPSKTSYDVDVRGNATKANIAVVKTDERSEVTGHGEHELEVGDNIIVLTVSSESGTNFYYTLNIRRALKEDNYLSDLTVNGRTVEGFNTTDITDVKDEYILEDVPYTTTTINLGAVKNDVDATIDSSMLGEKSLVVGQNRFEIVVRAQNGTPRTYVVKVTREKNDNYYLRLLSVAGSILKPNFNGRNIFEYEVTVAETKGELLASDVTAVSEDSNAKVTKPDRISLSTGIDNIYTITVEAENGETKDYVLKVKRPESSDATIGSIDVIGGTLNKPFNPNTEDYEISIPYGSDKFTINAIPSVESTIVPELGEINVSDLTDGRLIVTTTAENGNTKTYTFTVVVSQSDNATLSSLSIDGYPFDKEFKPAITNYDIGNILFGVTKLKVNATPNNSAATVEYYVDGVLQDSNIVNIPPALGSKTITVKVIAADGITPKQYSINYNVVNSNNVFLSDIIPSVGTLSPEFLKTKKEYEVTVENDVTSIDFTIETEDANASITVNGEVDSSPMSVTVPDLQVGNNTLSILVTAQDGKTTDTYNVVIKRLDPKASTDSKLKSLSVEGYPFTEEFNIDNLGDYNIGNVPYSVSELTINATQNFGASTISYLVDGVKQTSNVVSIPETPGRHAITVQVTAEDKKTVSDYKIIFEKAEPSKNAFLSMLTVSDGDLAFDRENYSYTVNLEEEVNQINLTADTESDTSRLVINGTEYSAPHTLTLTDIGSTTDVVIVVYAEDPTVSLTYRVRIKKGSGILDIITSDEYGHVVSQDYIETVALNTNGLHMKDQLDNDNEYLEIWNKNETKLIGDNENLSTGMIVKLIINGEEKDRKVVVIVGDTNGDGEIDLFDSVKILNHYLKKSFLEGPYLLAADVKKDTEIDLFDSVKVLNHYLKKSLLY